MNSPDHYTKIALYSGKILNDANISNKEYFIKLFVSV